MEIYRRFQLFEHELPALCAEVRLQRDELTFGHVEAHGVDGAHAAEGLAEPAHLEERHLTSPGAVGYGCREHPAAGKP